jgi:hypothetical protein
MPGEALSPLVKEIPFTTPTTASVKFSPFAREVFLEKRKPRLHNCISNVSD